MGLKHKGGIWEWDRCGSLDSSNKERGVCGAGSVRSPGLGSTGPTEDLGVFGCKGKKEKKGAPICGNTKVAGKGVIRLKSYGEQCLGWGQSHHVRGGLKQWIQKAPNITKKK